MRLLLIVFAALMLAGCATVPRPQADAMVQETARAKPVKRAAKPTPAPRKATFAERFAPAWQSPR